MTDPVSAVEFESMLLNRYHHVVRGGALDRSAYTLLSRMRAGGPMSISELSEAFHLDPSTLNRQTAALVRSGLAERIADPEGGIARKFRTTALGEQRLDEEREYNVTALKRILADWEPDEIAAFAAALQRFNVDIEKSSKMPWPRV